MIGPSTSETDNVCCEHNANLGVAGEHRKELQLETRMQIKLGLVDQDETRMAHGSGTRAHDELRKTSTQFVQTVAPVVNEELQSLLVLRRTYLEACELEG